MLIATIAQLAIPWVLGNIVQALSLLAGNHYSFIGSLGLLLSLLVVQQLASYQGLIRVGAIGENIFSDFRLRIHNKLLYLKQQKSLQHSNGNFVSLLRNESMLVSNFFSHQLATFLPQLFTLVGATVILLYINVYFGLLIIILMLVLVATSKLLGRRVRPLATEVMEQTKKNIGLFEQDIQLAEEIKTLVLEQNRKMEFRQSSENLLQISQEYLIRQNVLTPVAQLSGSVALIFVVVAIYIFNLKDTFSLSQIVTLLLYGLVITRPISGLAGLYGLSHQVLAAIERIDIFLSLDDEIGAKTGSNPEEPLEISSMKFDEVSFAYNKHETVLKACNIEILKGEKILIMGENGAGKSTVSKLIMRIMEPDSGCIYYNGKEARELSLFRIRKSIGFLPQYSNFFKGSVFENLTIGHDSVSKTKEDVKSELQKFELWPWVEKLPNALDTQITALGSNLSGGQRQKLNICRILLRQPKFLILDEPTSMFDPDSELEFLPILNRIIATKTVIIISHKQTMSGIVEKIYDLDNGQLKLRTSEL